jgi:hypothetical protein
MQVKAQEQRVQAVQADLQQEQQVRGHLLCKRDIHFPVVTCCVRRTWLIDPYRVYSCSGEKDPA